MNCECFTWARNLFDRNKLITVHNRGCEKFNLDNEVTSSIVNMLADIKSYDIALNHMTHLIGFSVVPTISYDVKIDDSLEKVTFIDFFKKFSYVKNKNGLMYNGNLVKIHYADEFNMVSTDCTNLFLMRHITAPIKYIILQKV